MKPAPTPSWEQASAQNLAQNVRTADPKNGEKTTSAVVPIVARDPLCDAHLAGYHLG